MKREGDRERERERNIVTWRGKSRSLQKYLRYHSKELAPCVKKNKAYSPPLIKKKETI
jgi:hypothetical protein